MKKKKKIILISIIVFVVVFIFGYNIYRNVEVNPEVKSKFVHAIGDKVYDGNEQELIFRGTNIGVELRIVNQIPSYNFSY